MTTSPARPSAEPPSRIVLVTSHVTPNTVAVIANGVMFFQKDSA